ncbi:phage terminase large subunit family protein [Haloarcula salinisoli]|uniref:Phage terminase large subunit family protein n=1 Tax=Haloarcula salinisoli TaxID=2487746 RepID=A0A8J7YKQ6_9EURY|nr:phage terminase large subunit family protein [Halomicroarcula salinisoli]MBX0304974.1 phage terminase large subunit family protein [Halomicroarcula salinisoli]
MTPDTPTADSPPKATLFCPECSHSSRYDGDWTRARSGQTVHYSCPDCHTEITTRPASAEPTAAPVTEFFTRWTDTVQTLQSAWLKTFFRA